jgi:transmembrane sensor
MEGHSRIQSLSKNYTPMRDEHYVIAELLEKYPDLNQEEQAQLNTWLEQGDNKNLFERIINKEGLKEVLRDLDQLKIESERSWDKLLQIRLRRGQGKLFFLRRYVVAASVIMILGVGGYFYYQFNKGQHTVVKGKETQVPIVADVNPGQYKAKLTLADGSVVVLDTITDKKLVQQGGTNVYSKGGQLIYEKKGKHNEILYNTLTTSKGEMYGMVLSDGSKRWLNSQSSIRYPVAFNSDIRKVEITGEAYFEVATARRISDNGQSGKLPFVVSVNGMEVEVLGTKFNINSYSNEEAIKTTLLVGKVKVRSTSNKAETILQPGQEAKLDKETKQLNKLDDIDVDEAVAWHYGYFQFNNADLETVMRQLVRWYDVEIVYQGAIPQREFWGKISRKNTLSQVLETLEKNNVHFKLEGKRIIVSP